MGSKVIKWSLRAVILVVIVCCVAVILMMQPTFESAQRLDYSQLASAARLQASVKTLSHDIPRETGVTSQLDSARDYIYRQLSEYVKDVELQSYEHEGQTFHNVIAKIKEGKGCPRIVFGAHYDAYKGLPGADDNASGVAALLELARLLSQPEVSDKINCSVELVAYANEEPPFFRTEGMGSYVHAKGLKEGNAQVQVMISLETMGFFSDEEGSQLYPVAFLEYLYPGKGNFITVVGNVGQIMPTRELKSAMQSVMDTQVYSINAPLSVPGIDYSDHRNYWAFGYPAVMVTDTAFNRNLNYHTADDTYEKLDYQRMAEVVNGLLHFVASQ
ncbi:M28 family peptidase [Kangiella shandongensis]|uniref:M28 family peptidase n=1 Tax=Kangiella shandongensis TaxID=2763258 RepID=UPI001CC1A87C|nr:M28 family peptidase [Kangiella shandongensis]